MGKRIIQQARGKGSLTYRVRRKAFVYKISYPKREGEAEIINIIKSAGHSAPLLKIKAGDEIFYIPAFNKAFIGQKIKINPKKPSEGDIAPLKSIPAGAQIYNIEINPGDGGKMIRTSGSSAVLLKKQDNRVLISMPSRKELSMSSDCRATLGTIAGAGRKLKPFMTAGRKHYKMKSRNKLWPRTSPIKVNAVDHPFGSGRGKRPKSKIAKRNAPPGRRVGHIRPRRVGRR